MAREIKAEQIVQAWGNGLGVRITAAVAKAARFHKGLPVSVEVVDDGVLVRPCGKTRMTLEQKLAAFDPHLHGAESMADAAIGKETL